MHIIYTGKAILNETFGQTNSADVYLYNNNSECSKKNLYGSHSSFMMDYFYSDF